MYLTAIVCNGGARDYTCRAACRSHGQLSHTMLPLPISVKSGGTMVIFYWTLLGSCMCESKKGSFFRSRPQSCKCILLPWQKYGALPSLLLEHATGEKIPCERYAEGYHTITGGFLDFKNIRV